MKNRNKRVAMFVTFALILSLAFSAAGISSVSGQDLFSMTALASDGESSKSDSSDQIKPSGQDTPESSVKTDLSSASVKAGNVTYNGKARKPSVTVVLRGSTLTGDEDYSVTYKNNVKAGTAKIVISGKGDYTGTASGTFKINKAKQSISANGKTVTLSAKSLKKGNKSLGIAKTMTVKKAFGTKTYSIDKVKKTSAKKYFSINSSTGKIKVKKGLKKGTYKVTVKVSAKGNSNYKSGSGKAVVTIKVK